MPQEDPQQQMQQGQQPNPGGEPGSPNQEQEQSVSPEDVAFDDVRGKTIKTVKFTKPGVNAGQVEIYFVDDDIPMTIAWANDRVTVSKPPTGEPVVLS